MTCFRYRDRVRRGKWWREQERKERGTLGRRGERGGESLSEKTDTFIFLPSGNRHTETQKHPQTERQTERQTHTCTHRGSYTVYTHAHKQTHANTGVHTQKAAYLYAHGTVMNVRLKLNTVIQILSITT